MADQLMAYTTDLQALVRDKTIALTEANERLEHASRHKSDFLAHMSHELRTPLNAVIGFSEMLKAQYFGPLNDKQAEYVRDIHASGQHLLSLINDILDLAKVEAGRMELVRADTNVTSVVEACCALVSERLARKQQTLTVRLAPDVGTWSLDGRKFKQCLLNLLSNAGKFTANGGHIALRVHVEGHALLVEVEDNGVGIDAAEIPKLFSEFYQASSNSSQSGAKEGTGLGLALTRKFVELHGGSVDVRSALGHGSTFTLRFPRHQESHGANSGH